MQNWKSRTANTKSYCCVREICEYVNHTRERSKYTNIWNIAYHYVILHKLRYMEGGWDSSQYIPIERNQQQDQKRPENDEEVAPVWLFANLSFYRVSQG